MKLSMKFFLRILTVAFAILVSGGIWWYYFDSRAPQSRPDLVRLPSSIPAPPKGYPSLNALMVNYALGRLDLVDIESPFPLPSGVTEELDREYGRVGDRALLLDLYSPRDIVGTTPGILFIHGGGWSSGDKSDYRIYATHFAKLGYVVGSVGYRLKKEATYPAAIEDVKCAVRWMRAHAEELRVDPDRIAVVGGSAGGHLSMMVAYSSDVLELEGTGGWSETSSAVQAVVDLYGPTDFTTPYGRTHKTTTSYLVKSYEEAPELYEQCSPLFHVDATDPPTLIFQGTLDDLVPVEQSDRLAAKLESLGVPYWYDRLDGWPHTMDLARPISERVKTVIEAFFDEFLSDDPKNATSE